MLVVGGPKNACRTCDDVVVQSPAPIATDALERIKALSTIEVEIRGRDPETSLGPSA